MKSKVTNFPELEEKLTEIVRSAKEALEFMKGLRGESVPAPPARNGKVEIEMPEGFSDRIKAILRTSTKSLRTKQVVDAYQALKWPEPQGGRPKLYDNTAASLSYLVNTQKTVIRSDDGKYSLKSKEEKQ